MRIMLGFCTRSRRVWNNTLTALEKKKMNSNLKFYIQSNVRQSLKFYFPNILYHEAAGGCAPPNEESKPRKEEEGVGSENRGNPA